MKKYALGYFGRLLAPVDSNVLDRIVANGSPQIGREPQPLLPSVAKLRKKYPNMSDDERILRFNFSGGQIDDMLAAGPIKTEYVFEKPLVRLMRELAARRITRVYFSRGPMSDRSEGEVSRLEYGTSMSRKEEFFGG